MKLYVHVFSGYLCKQVIRRYKDCDACKQGVICASPHPSSLTQLTDMKSHGFLIHPNIKFYQFIRHAESCFALHASKKHVFELTVEQVLSTHSFAFPCAHHASDILSFALFYYIRMRMRHYCYQAKREESQKFVVKKKLSKFTVR